MVRSQGAPGKTRRSHPMQSEELGPLVNGNPRGNPHLAPRCGATTRSDTMCRAPAMRNGRCRMHGGKSTGPRTAAGRARAALTNWRHGGYCKEAVEERKGVLRLLRQLAWPCHLLLPGHLRESGSVAMAARDLERGAKATDKSPPLVHRLGESASPNSLRAS